MDARMNPDHVQAVRTAAKCVTRDLSLALVEETTQRAIATTGRGLDLADADLSNLDCRGFNLSYATFNRAALHGSKFDEADLTAATLICPGLERTSFRGANLRGVYVHALAAQVCNFDEAILDEMLDGTGSLFHGCSMRGTSLVGARLAGATFYQCDLSGAHLTRATLQGATINECNLTSADLNTTDVAQLTVTKCLMTAISLAGAVGDGLVIQRPTTAIRLNLTGASLPGLRLASVRSRGLLANGLAAPGLDLDACWIGDGAFGEANLTGARMVGCVFDRTSFVSAKLTGAQLRACVFARCTLSRVDAENLHAVETSMVEADMTGFAGRAAVFRDCDLTDANLSGAYLYRAMLTGDPPAAMSLVRASLNGANLVQAYIAADCTGGDWRGAKCAYARLNQAMFRRTDLSGAGLYEASLVKTNFTDARLVGVQAPFFADRCAGLEAALYVVGAQDALDCVQRAKTVTSVGSAGST
jgi:uncharacterized protein YjbI with pentapeptide repeats